jgi:DhnA family fructose-bisphosphate aldolase class Ia
MSMPGKRIRLGRIFGNNDRTLIVPIDHGLGSGPVQGLERVEDVIEMLTAAKVDAILTTYGSAKRYAHLFKRIGLILRIDGGPTDYATDPEATTIMYSVEDAVQLGADAIITSIWLGGSHEVRTAVDAMKLAAACDRWGMPLIIETFMSAEKEATIENVSMASRIAAELGADMVKTYLTGNVDSYRRVTETCFRPVVILGGEKSEDPLSVLHWARTALDAGAAGTCIGRNIFQHNNPPGLLAALAKIIHDDMNVEQVRDLV